MTANAPPTRNGKFIAVANMKGGVGKTTTLVSLADALAADDLACAVLVIDLDPQASASVCIADDALLSQLINQGRTFEAFLNARLIKQESADLYALIRKQISPVSHRGEQLNVSLLPCGPYLRIVERELLYAMARRNGSAATIDEQIWRLFKHEIAALGARYDYVLFDCAPGISPVTEAAIRMSDLVIVPTIPDHLSVYGLNAFHGSLWVQQSGGLPKPKSAPHILISRLLGTRQHREMVEELIDGAKRNDGVYKLIRASIPQSAGLADALMRPGCPTFTQKYTSQIIDTILTPLVTEIKGLL